MNKGKSDSTLAMKKKAKRTYYVPAVITITLITIIATAAVATIAVTIATIEAATPLATISHRYSYIMRH